MGSIYSANAASQIFYFKVVRPDQDHSHEIFFIKSISKDNKIFHVFPDHCQLFSKHSLCIQMKIKEKRFLRKNITLSVVLNSPEKEIYYRNDSFYFYNICLSKKDEIEEKFRKIRALREHGSEKMKQYHIEKKAKKELQNITDANSRMDVQQPANKKSFFELDEESQNAKIKEALEKMKIERKKKKDEKDKFDALVKEKMKELAKLKNIDLK